MRVPGCMQSVDFWTHGPLSEAEEQIVSAEKVMRAEHRGGRRTIDKASKVLCAHALTLEHLDGHQQRIIQDCLVHLGVHTASG